MKKTKIGLLGFGSLGQFIYHTICSETYEEEYEIVFVWNRSAEKLDDANIPESMRLAGNDPGAALKKYLEENEVDILFEAAHADVVKQTFKTGIKHCDYMPTSLTAWADEAFEDEARHALKQSGHRLCIPAGASWGMVDICRMSDVSRLEEVNIKMTFGADALKVSGPIKEELRNFLSSEKEQGRIAHGSVRKIAEHAPQNCNTMVGIALAAHELGLDGVYGELWADKTADEHVVEIDIRDESGMRVKSIRSNPAQKGAVTGDSTFFSFLSSLLRIQRDPSDILFC